MPNDEFPVEDFDASQFFNSEEEVNAPEYALEGLYHLGVQAVDASGKNSTGAVFLTFAILEGNVPNQIGKEIRFPVWPPHPDAKDPERAKKQWMKVVLRLMLVLGLRKEGEFPAKFRPDASWWEALEGMQCIGRVSHQKKKQTTEGGVEKEWITAHIKDRDDLFAIGSKDAKSVPLDQNALVTGGYVETDEI